MDDEEQLENRDAEYATQLADEALRAVEQLFEECPDDHKYRFAMLIRNWGLETFDNT